MRHADLVVTDADVRTMDAEHPRATTVVLAGGRVAAVGGDDLVADWRGPRTEVLDARGRAVWPGLTDSHTHFHRASMLEAEYLNFAALEPRSLADVLEHVRARAEATPAGGWVQGDSLEALALAENRYPDRYELDAVSAGRPVVVRGVGRHVIAANSLALELAGIDRGTPDPSGGRVERDADGVPTGILHERGKLRLDATRADSVVPPLDERTRLAALHAGFRRLQSLGVTTIHDIQREPREISDYITLRTRDELGVRIRLYPRAVEAQTRLEHFLGLGLTTGFGDDLLRLAGIKISVDGSLTIGNAALYEPYPEQPDNLGIVRVGPDELREAMAAAHGARLQVAVHAIGQRAVDIALDAYEAVLKEAPAPHRHRVEHGFMPPLPGQLARMADLGLVLSTQPSMLYSEGDAWVRLLGEERVRGAWPMRSAVDAGVRVQINSDYPCSPLDPLVGLRAAVARRTRDGRTIGPEEAVGLEEALAMMTLAPAYAGFDEHRGGCLRPGHYGDLVVLSADPFALPAGEWGQVRVDATVLDGRLVYERGA